MTFLNKIFFNIGYLSASNPLTCCWFALMLTMVFSLGFVNFQLTVSIFISKIKSLSLIGKHDDQIYIERSVSALGAR